MPQGRLRTRSCLAERCWDRNRCRQSRALPVIRAVACESRVPVQQQQLFLHRTSPIGRENRLPNWLGLETSLPQNSKELKLSETLSKKARPRRSQEQSLMRSEVRLVLGK